MELCYTQGGEGLLEEEDGGWIALLGVCLERAVGQHYPQRNRNHVQLLWVDPLEAHDEHLEAVHDPAEGQVLRHEQEGIGDRVALEDQPDEPETAQEEPRLEYAVVVHLDVALRHLLVLYLQRQLVQQLHLNVHYSP